ncbi:hypothetical protein, partial [Providencia stuartii]|uniref:hypothetical protein n=3 Tax=Providencia TaxID=586 RepID=UPI001892A1C2
MTSIVLRNIQDMVFERSSGSIVSYSENGDAAVIKKVGSSNTDRAYLTKSFPVRPGATYTFSIEAKINSESITGGIYIDYPHESNFQQYKFNHRDWKLYKISFTVPTHSNTGENWKKSVMKISAGIITGGTEGEIILKNPLL